VFGREIHIPVQRFVETFVRIAVPAAAIAKIVGKDAARRLEHIAAKVIDRLDLAAPHQTLEHLLRQILGDGGIGNAAAKITEQGRAIVPVQRIERDVARRIRRQFPACGQR